MSPPCSCLAVSPRARGRPLGLTVSWVERKSKPDSGKGHSLERCGRELILSSTRPRDALESDIEFPCLGATPLPLRGRRKALDETKPVSDGPLGSGVLRDKAQMSDLAGPFCPDVKGKNP